jgi:capsular polysaccharide biosynthesis protein
MTFVTFVVRLLLVAVIAALVGVAALWFSQSQPVRYEARTKLAFSADVRPELQVLGAPFVRPNIDPKLFTATTAQFVASQRVASDVARRRPDLRLTADQVAGRVTVAAITGTEVIQISATDDTRAGAEDLARSYEAAFIAWFQDRQRRRARAVQGVLRRRYELLSPTLRGTGTGQTLREQMTALDVLASIGSGSPEVVEGAHASASPKQPQTRRNVIFGVLFGLAVGIGLVALRSELRKRPGVPG